MEHPFSGDVEFLRTILNTYPAMVFIVKQDMEIVEANTAALTLYPPDSVRALHMRGGEMLQCVHVTVKNQRCGEAEMCKKCEVRNAVRDAFDGHHVVRRKARMEWVCKGHHDEVFLLITAAPFERNGQNYALLILEDISEHIMLRRILPICASCKKIRDDQQYWENVEVYFKKQLDVDFTHSICPQCRERLYPNLSNPPESPDTFPEQP